MLLQLDSDQPNFRGHIAFRQPFLVGLKFRAVDDSRGIRRSGK